MAKEWRCCSTEKALAAEACVGICEDAFQKKGFDFMALKHELREKGIAMNTYEASVSFDELKQNSDGLLPVVVQDYKTQEVLMVAYMNREAFETTVRTGRMTYFSRSRQELLDQGADIRTFSVCQRAEDRLRQ